MTTLNLRPYQTEAVQTTREAWSRGVRRPAIVLPTGAGKTVVFASVAAIMHPLGVRTLVLAHRTELIEQAAAKIRAVAPHLMVGIVKGSRREIHGRDVIVASVQSLARAERRAELARAGVRLVIIDEAHHAVADTYMAVLRDLGAFEADPLKGAYALGVTATMGRSDRVALSQAWEDVVYRRDIMDMIRGGYLVNAKGIRVRVDGLDLRAVKRRAGDFGDQALADALHDSLAPKAIARAYTEHAGQRSGVLFAPTVESAYEMRDAMREAGVSAETVHGALPAPERKAVLAAHARGDVQMITNCMVLTEGWDAPWCSAVVIARPTSSTSLYVQMAGRGLRTHPGKRDAVILDVVGVTGKHRLASVADLAGADRVEKLADDLAEYDEIDLLGLDELADAPAAGGGGLGRIEGADGPLVSEVVDLFGSRRQAWLRTPKGVWFLSAGDQIVFLTPDETVGRYRVAMAPARESGGRFLESDVDLDMAMSWGEQHAIAAAGVLTRKGAAWRRAAPSAVQLTAAERMGIPTEGLTKGELSDALSTAYAAERIDQMPCVATVTDKGYW